MNVFPQQIYSDSHYKFIFKGTFSYIFVNKIDWKYMPPFKPQVSVTLLIVKESSE